jgi:Rrf2 family protein
MVDLVRHFDGSAPVHLRKIAEDNDLSHGYLEQLMISLRNASLVRGLSGRKGGYVLARPAEDITLTEIVEAAIGPINVVDCVSFPENCGIYTECKTRPIWVMINHAVREVLDSYTLAQMADDRWLETMSLRLEEVTGVRPVQPSPTRAGAQPSRRSSEPVTAARGVGSTPCGRPMPVEPAPRKKTRNTPRSKKSSK